MPSPTKSALISDKDVRTVLVRQHLVPRPLQRVNIGRKFESCNMTSEMKASYDAGIMLATASLSLDKHQSWILGGSCKWK